MGAKISNDLGEMAEINVTPLVDVMLVLLIIFIITTPMLVQGLNVNLPKQNAPAMVSEENEEPVILTLTAERDIRLGDQPVHISLLGARLRSLIRQEGQQPIYLKADSSLQYGYVVKVLAVLDEAGVEQVGMVTEPEEP